MTTAEFITCYFLGCGVNDISIFDKLTDNEYFYAAAEELKSQMIPLTAGDIWYTAINQALVDVFGTTEYFELYFDYYASSVSLSVSPDTIEDFEEKASRFEDLTGFSIERA